MVAGDRTPAVGCARFGAANTATQRITPIIGDMGSLAWAMMIIAIVGVGRERMARRTAFRITQDSMNM